MEARVCIEIGEEDGTTTFRVFRSEPVVLGRLTGADDDDLAAWNGAAADQFELGRAVVDRVAGEALDSMKSALGQASQVMRAGSAE